MQELHDYVKENNEHALKNMLVHNKQYVNAQDEEGYTPLHWAAYYGHVRILQLLLDNGAHVDERDHAGQSALHWAAQSRNQMLTSANILLTYGANIHAHNTYKQTPLKIALLNGQEILIKFFLENGAGLKVNFGNCQLKFDTSNILFIGCRINDKPMNRTLEGYHETITNKEELIEALRKKVFINIKANYRSCQNYFITNGYDKDIDELKVLLLTHITLKNQCLFYIKNNLESYRKNSQLTILPSSLIEEIESLHLNI